MIKTVGELKDAIEGYEDDQEMKILVNGDDLVYYEIINIGNDGAGAMEVTII